MYVHLLPVGHTAVLTSSAVWLDVRTSAASGTHSSTDIFSSLARCTYICCQWDTQQYWHLQQRLYFFSAITFALNTDTPRLNAISDWGNSQRREQFFLAGMKAQWVKRRGRILLDDKLDRKNSHDAAYQFLVCCSLNFNRLPLYIHQQLTTCTLDLHLREVRHAPRPYRMWLWRTSV